MATNSELEKQVNQLRTELDALKETLDRAFHAANLWTEWAQSKPLRPIVESTSQNEVAPAPTSAVLNFSEIGALMREFFPNGAPTLDEIKQLIEKE